MTQDYEFDVINELASLDFVTAISPMAATDKGYEVGQDVHPRYRNEPFTRRFNHEVEEDGHEYPAVYQLSFAAPEDTDTDFDSMMREVESIVNEHSVTSCIGNFDAGVPKDDWSGWDIDPIVDVLCVKDGGADHN